MGRKNRVNFDAALRSGEGFVDGMELLLDDEPSGTSLGEFVWIGDGDLNDLTMFVGNETFLVGGGVDMLRFGTSREVVGLGDPFAPSTNLEDDEVSCAITFVSI